MRPDAAFQLPRTIAAVCAVIGGVVLAGTTVAVGRQHIAAHWQFVVVAAGLGIGLLFVAGALYGASRRREGQWRVEEALARLLVAAAAMPARATPAPTPESVPAFTSTMELPAIDERSNGHG